LKKLNEWNGQRRQIAQIYNSKIKNEKIVLPQIPDDIQEHVFHIYPILVENRNEFLSYMQKAGIATLVHYPTPIMEQKAYSEYKNESDYYPVTKQICAKEVSIPLYPGMQEEQIEYIVDCMNRY